MARKRMFDIEIINQDSFFDLPMDAKALYFLLGMEADDEGFVAPKKVLRLYGGSEDSIKILILKNYLIPFKSGVVVITDWKRNNYIDKSRLKETIYTDEKKLITYDESKEKYVLNECLTNVKQMLNECSTDVKQMLNQSSIDKISIDKVSIEEDSIGECEGEINSSPVTTETEKIHFAEFVTMTNEEYNKLCLTHSKEFADQCIEKLDNYKGSSGKKYKSDYRAILSWVVDEVKKATPKNTYNQSGNVFIDILREEGVIDG